ncbi:mediator of RNA polymerase II transcription subunit 15-like [Plodia interpunctella]|uniref:mediator of RNA polymerase II transcription subunit 15-like n=1 Tax=Plodia interpunctella TaxID=58824 RepID=UPI002368B99B|nr:mediator of RNA polymerase II transcription subunit 15-like [Plodia interpunctella]
MQHTRPGVHARLTPPRKNHSNLERLENFFRILCQCLAIAVKMKLFILFAIALCAYAADVKETEKKSETKLKTEDDALNKDKRQTQEEYLPGQLVYRVPRKQKAAPVQEPQDEDRNNRQDSQEYRPGQVFSLNAQELLEFQQERKAPLSSNQLLQQLQLYGQEKPNPQQFYYVEPQAARQVAYQPSHAVIARPHYSADGGEASVGAALSVSDSGPSSSSSFDQELLALLGHQVGQDDRQYQQQTVSQNAPAPQYQQVDRYITKPSKKPTKLRPKVATPPQVPQPLPAGAPQQYLIETTNVQQQPQQPQPQIQYRPAPQAQRPAQALRYVPIPSPQPDLQQVLYERPESQGLKIVPAPKLQQQQPRQQLSFRLIPQFQQPEATPKQYRIIDAPVRQPVRQEQRAPAVERPLTYLKRYPDPEKVRAVKIYDPEIAAGQQPQIVGEQYYLRPYYRQNEPLRQERLRYESPLPARPDADPPRAPEPTKPPHSAIYVSKNLAPKKSRVQSRPEEVRIDQSSREQYRQEPTYRQEPNYRQSQRLEQQVNLEQHGQSLDNRRVQLPPPKNNKAYTPEEFAALVAAGYSVTPVPVSALNAQAAQSRSSEDLSPITIPQQSRRPLYRRPQYLPLRGDDAP